MKQTGIIILNWNAAQDTINCVHNFQDFSAHGISIYVIDNNSDLADREKIQRECQDIIFIQNDSNLGYAGGNNVGIRQALKDGCAYILLMNNDARIAEKDFQLLVQALDTEPNLGIIGPIIRDHNGGILNAGGRDIGEHYISHFKEPVQPDAIYDVDYVSGTICLMRSSLLEQIGLLDEAYFFSGEVADLCQRAKKQGKSSMTSNSSGAPWRIAVNPLVSGSHDLSASHDNRGGIYTYYTVRNRFLYIRKHLHASIPRLFLFWTSQHLRHARHCFREEKKTELRMVLKGLLHGLMGKYGPLN
ncbi:glycosyltransferase family 2 protein [Candidatus Electrothrix sp.]|uniref:glycosyltransferase family 2 protein n=1 Tax=Candidatus Electrothrix sp. TaxID=2170559 RepID=UPI004056C09F